LRTSGSSAWRACKLLFVVDLRRQYINGLSSRIMPSLAIHLVDGTYELFRQFYGRRHFEKNSPAPLGAVAGVLHSILEMIEKGATHVGVATDHVIESFRNDLWPGYKTGAGIERALRAQFHPLEEALRAMGVAVWPMVELEADDALASAAHLAAADETVGQVCIWTPDKDLAQCVRGDRVVQVLRKAKTILDAAGVTKKFGVPPERIPDLLALVGDDADGYPGIDGIGRIGAARLIQEHGALEEFPPSVLGKDRERALLFKKLATLRTDADLFADVEALRWRGPTDAFPALAARIADPRLLARCAEAATKSRRPAD
jgi:5'-3' exonuclease